MSKELAVGDELPSVSMRPTALQLFRYSAVTWNTHRIHYDPDWAKREGHAGVLVHSHLHAANALRVLTDGLGPEWVIRSVSYRIVAPAPAGDTLKATARVTGVSDDGREVRFQLAEVNAAGNTCLEGTATVRRLT